MSVIPPEKEYLFLFSIGPVQSFIEAARKTQDLWAGSYLLSYLVKAAIAKTESERAKSEKDLEIVFPLLSSGSDNEAAILPNHLLLHLRSGWDEMKLRDLGSGLQGSVRTAFEDICKFGKRKISDAKDLSSRHVEDMLELYWAAVAVNPTLRHGDNFRRTEIALAARKNLKIFKQAAPEQSLKCSLCGERQALHLPGKSDFRDVRHFWQEIARYKSRFSGKEYLCTVCLGKRYAPDFFQERRYIARTTFPSTAEVAASAYKRILMQEVREAYDNFENELRPTMGMSGRLLPVLAACNGGGEETVDAHWLYESNYSDKGLENQGVKTNKFANLRKEVKKLHQASVEKRHNIKLTPYYAVLIMDADHMGRKLSRVSTLEQHMDVSKKLADFAAGQARNIVENGSHLGKLVYAGGDDLLALVSLESLLPLMEELRSIFAKEMNSSFPSLTNNGSEPFSLSAGVCISHFKDPLRVALLQARRMLDLAKDDMGGTRNAFAIVVQTSGNHKQTFMPWGINQTSASLPLCHSLEKLADLLRRGVLSDRFVHRFGGEFRSLLESDGRLGNAFQTLSPVSAEFSRLMNRAVNLDALKLYYEKDKKESLAALHELAGILFAAFEQMANYNLGNFISLLDVISFIGRETNQ